MRGQNSDNSFQTQILLQDSYASKYIGLSKCLGTARHVQVEAPPRIHEVPAG